MLFLRSPTAAGIELLLRNPMSWIPIARGQHLAAALPDLEWFQTGLVLSEDGKIRWEKVHQKKASVLKGAVRFCQIRLSVREVLVIS